MIISIFRTIRAVRLLLPLAMLVILSTAALAGAASGKAARKAFPTPDEAAAALAAAIKGDDTAALLAVLGPGSKDIVTSGDPVADKAGRERFIRLYEEKLVIERRADGAAQLSLGNEEYPFPIPLVKRNSGWVFDARAGREELLNRRIGRNELEVIEVLRAYVDAQRDYAAKDRDGSGSGVFARRLRSTPGKRDGLYWEKGEGEEESPLGPLVAQAGRDGYGRIKTGNDPFHGYYFRVLTGQGKAASGGAYDYVANGRMVLGFAMVAYPARYGNSGVMTFVVNQSGVVYQKDLGKNTGRIAGAMKLYNPDAGWKRVE